MARRIVFSDITDSFNEEHDSESSIDGSLTLSSRLRHIIVKSTLKSPKDVSILTTSGIRLCTFTVNPGQTVEIPVKLPGFYVVNRTKIAVR
jgi:hypothetical protein